MSCCITAHYNPLALPVFHHLAQCNQTFYFSFFSIAIVLRILSFLHAHPYPATAQQLFSTGTMDFEHHSQVSAGPKLGSRVYSTMTYI